ncbi:MAG: hypothetical protein M1816_008011 [Peltula sp. TS41687]|nr:MAG: hypothetical protein M1816_008011 [Peltula sp. TS41687]
MSDPGTATELIGWTAYKFSRVLPHLPIFFALLLGALYPIYTGAHASLSRPSSAEEPKRRAKSNAACLIDEEDENAAKEESTHSKRTGLSPADALWFPLLGGLLLGGLYQLIKWMEDPDFLNKIFNWWFSLLGVGTVGALLTDSLSVLKTFVFPSRWSDGKTLWHVRPGDDKYVSQSTTVHNGDRHSMIRTSPFPGWMSYVPLPEIIRKAIWSNRKTLASRYLLQLDVRGVTRYRSTFDICDLVGYGAALSLALIFTFIERAWWLMNVFAFGSSYTVIQVLTPKTFWTGTMILSALFVYDVYMVFFTPLMATVATTLEIPIKLVFPHSGTPGDEAPTTYAMLGLGDVVLPGMIIALALRFDLYVFYLRKQTMRKSLKATVSEENDDYMPDRPLEIVKAPYRSVTGRWGERFWTRRGYGGRIATQADPATFPKPYFYTTLIGYVFSMFVTFGILALTKHAQPALLYLAPGVLVPAWGLAYFRGEMGEFWRYTEDADDDEQDADNAPKPRSTDDDDSKPTESENGPDKKKQAVKHAISLQTPTSGSSSKLEKLFVVTLAVRTPRPPPPTNIQSTSPTRPTSPNISPSIVEEIRKALDDDMDLRASRPTTPRGSHSSHTFPHHRHQHHHHQASYNSTEDGGSPPAEKRLRIE